MMLAVSANSLQIPFSWGNGVYVPLPQIWATLVTGQ